VFTLLKGLKVVDLTTIVLGPYATQILGDLGADVIKVESLEGDVFRSVRPGRRDDLGVAFLNYNRNKRSVALDLKQARGQEILHALVAEADVFVHNMRSRSAAHLGASFETLKEINPGLVYCYSPGFSELGPDRDAPAYDDIIQARSGLAALNADAAGAPRFVRTIACDKIVGLHLALAVAAGVIQKERTGKGVCIEAPMLESMVSFLLSEHLAGHTLIPEEGELGYDRMMSANRKPYRTEDGYLAILPYSTKHWIRFFQICHLDDWATADKVIDPVLRSEHIDELYGKVAELALTRTTEAWLAALAEQDIPCSRVNSMADLFDDEHLEAARMFTELNDARVGEMRELRSPFQIDGALAHEAQANTVAPGLGEHTEAVLLELGYSKSEIVELERDAVIGSLGSE
jgi:crotonobetainyl-CoA:carnitine CoA-transferase CaiB-like acyl-CoA transferase